MADGDLALGHVRRGRGLQERRHRCVEIECLVAHERADDCRCETFGHRVRVRQVIRRTTAVVALEGDLASMQDNEAFGVTKLGQALDPGVRRGEQIEVEAAFHTSSFADRLGTRSGSYEPGAESLQPARRGSRGRSRQPCDQTGAAAERGSARRPLHGNGMPAGGSL